MRRRRSILPLRQSTAPESIQSFLFSCPLLTRGILVLRHAFSNSRCVRGSPGSLLISPAATWRKPAQIKEIANHSDENDTPEPLRQPQLEMRRLRVWMMPPRCSSELQQTHLTEYPKRLQPRQSAWRWCHVC